MSRHIEMCANRWCCGIVALLCVPASALAQATSSDIRPELAGGWTLNREASTFAAGGDTGRGSERGGGDRGAGLGRPGGAGRGGFGGFGGGRGDVPQIDERERTAMQAAMTEVMEAPVHLIVTQDPGSVTFVDGEGRSRRYETSDKKEKHQLQGATIETRTKWDRTRLRQDISLARGSIARTFEIAPETHQLIVTITMPAPPGGGRPPTVRHVYDRDEPLN